MRHDTDEVRLANRGDLHHLGDAPHVRQCGADIVDIMMLHQLVEVPAISPLLAGGNRDLDHSPQNRQVLLKRLRPDRVLYKKRRKALDQVASANRVRKIKPLVEIDHPIAALSDAIARLYTILIDLVESFARV